MRTVAACALAALLLAGARLDRFEKRLAILEQPGTMHVCSSCSGNGSRAFEPNDGPTYYDTGRRWMEDSNRYVAEPVAEIVLVGVPEDEAAFMALSGTIFCDEVRAAPKLNDAVIGLDGRDTAGRGSLCFYSGVAALCKDGGLLAFRLGAYKVQHHPNRGGCLWANADLRCRGCGGRGWVVQ